MSFTSLEMADATSGNDVVIQKTSGTPLNQPGGPLSQATFGIDSTGTPYFDNAGPASGEAAMLVWDGSVGEWFADGSGAAQGSDPHLMLVTGPPRRVGRPALPVAVARAPRASTAGGRKRIVSRRPRTIRRDSGQADRAAARAQVQLMPVEANASRDQRAAARETVQTLPSWPLLDRDHATGAAPACQPVSSHANASRDRRQPRPVTLPGSTVFGVHAPIIPAPESHLDAAPEAQQQRARGRAGDRLQIDHSVFSEHRRLRAVGRRET